MPATSWISEKVHDSDFERGESMKQSLKEAIADRKWWQEASDALGWKLYGWTFRRSASFWDKHGESVHLTGDQRNDIVDALGKR